MGEQALYEIIIRRYNPYLFKVGRSYNFNHADTEDLMQDTFVSAYTGLSGFENRSSLKTWLVKIMLSHCYHKRRKFSFKNEFPSNVIEHIDGIPMFSHTNSNPAKTMLNNELKHVLEEALVQVPEKYRMVFTLRELNGMSITETSEALDISESNVKVRHKRAKVMLQREIRKMYTPEEIFEFNLIYCNRIVSNVLVRIRPRNESTPFSFVNLAGLKKRMGAIFSGMWGR